MIGSWCFGGLVAVITGHVARHQIRRTGEAGGSLALAGLIAGYLALAISLLFILAYVGFFVFVIADTHKHGQPGRSLCLLLRGPKGWRSERDEGEDHYVLGEVNDPGPARPARLDHAPCQHEAEDRGANYSEKP